MEFCSITFLFPILLLASLSSLLPRLRWRQAVLAAVNLFVLGTVLPTWTSAVMLGLLIGSGYLAGRSLRRRPRRVLLVAYLLVLVGLFLYLENFSVISAWVPSRWLNRSVEIIGLGFLLFRQIHFLVDQYRGSEAPLDLWGYLNYQINVFSLVMGPVTRYPEFRRDWDQLECRWFSRQDLLLIYARIAFGVIKVLVLGALCLHYYRFGRPLLDPETAAAAGHPLIQTLFLFYSFPLYLFFNFSGYCDIVIGCGRLFGLRLPENFNNPLISRNMLEFWSRWHITLGAWIREYLYTPMLRTASGWFPRRGAGLAVACSFLAFLVTGLWHGSTWNLVVFGLLQGLGVAAAKLWELLLARWLDADGRKRYLTSPSLRWTAIGLTFHFVCFSCLFFGLNPSELRNLVLALGSLP